MARSSRRWGGIVRWSSRPPPARASPRACPAGSSTRAAHGCWWSNPAGSRHGLSRAGSPKNGAASSATRSGIRCASRGDTARTRRSCSSPRASRCRCCRSARPRSASTRWSWTSFTSARGRSTSSSRWLHRCANRCDQTLAAPSSCCARRRWPSASWRRRSMPRSCTAKVEPFPWRSSTKATGRRPIAISMSGSRARCRPPCATGRATCSCSCRARGRSSDAGVRCRIARPRSSPCTVALPRVASRMRWGRRRGNGCFCRPTSPRRP